jgi:hypothetical protein
MRRARCELFEQFLQNCLVDRYLSRSRTSGLTR